MILKSQEVALWNGKYGYMMATNINVPSHFEHNFSIACDKFIGAILPDLSKTFD